MKHNNTKLPALILSAALLTGGIGNAAYAISIDSTAPQPSVKPSTTAAEDQTGLTKDETVYVLAGADGSVQKIIVSDWIKNTIGSASVADKSTLSNVENVKGSETYTMSGDNMRVWDAKGNDIYYQGNIEKELPVTISVTYQLDGKSISPAELAGKSGRVTIRFDYTNSQYEMVEIDGKQEKIYVPFAMLTGLLLDNERFTNVAVKNGKLINDGNRTAVVGLAFPGLQSNLKLDASKLEIPDYVEITADVKDFEMTNTVTIATNEVFSRFRTDSLNSIEDLTASLEELDSAMGQLMDGSSKLYDGLCTLLDKSGVLVSGINQLAEGAAKLKSGAGDLNQGAAELTLGAQELAAGLGQLSANNSTLNTGAKQIFDSLLVTADTQLAAAGLVVPKLTIENYAAVLNGVIASLDKDKVAEQARQAALEAVTKAVNAQHDTIQAAVAAKIEEEVSAKVADAVYANVEAQVLAAFGLTKHSYEVGIAAGTVSADTQARITAAIQAQMESNAVKSTIAAQVQSQMQAAEIRALVTAKTEEQTALQIEQNMNSAQVQAQITAALEQAASGAASISALKEQLDSYNAFYAGLRQYTAGVTSAKDGADALNTGAGQLKAGTAELYAGMSALYDGVLTLEDGTPALVSGVSALRDGAMQLTDGLKEFNDKGVQKLMDAVDRNLGGLLTRINATADVSKDYQSFSGLSTDMDGHVKFIYRTESIQPK